ncbi:MAG: class I SAM-dependent methyltransferase [Proteobacteria bacterium]|nr:class I SAM-dependent methyltransferase [Pseudomonadota bacterium]
MLNNLEEYIDPSLYDAEYGGYQGDSDLFLNLIHEGNVLDLACGTGRLTIPLAKKGLKVVGLDASEPMLTLAREKSKELPIEWTQGDIRDFYLDETFDLILMAGNAFQALLLDEDQLRMLNCVRKHLKPSGLFVFNTRNPQENDFKDVDKFEFWHTFQDQQGEAVEVYGKQQSDPSHQIVTYTTKRVWKDKETLTKIRLRFTPYEQLMDLLRKAGFKVCEVFGDDQKRPLYKDSPSIIPVCS